MTGVCVCVCVLGGGCVAGVRACVWGCGGGGGECACVSAGMDE